MLNALFVIYLILLLLRPNEFVPALQHVAFLQVLLLICTGLWVFRKDKQLATPQFPMCAWFAVAAMLSVGFAGWWGGAIPRLAYITPILLVFVLISMVAREINMLRRILFWIIVCACIMVLHGKLQLLYGVGWTGLPPLLGRITYVGIFSDPNDLGQLFVICIAFCVYLYRGAGKLRRLAIMATVAWLCYGIVMTDSRGTMLAVLAVLALPAIRRYGYTVVGALGAVAGAVLVATTRFGQINPNEESAMGRVESWYAGMQMFLSHPLFGVGMGNYTEHHFLTAHNLFMLPIAELGLFGFIPWLGILWFTTRMLIWLPRSPHVPVDPSVTTPAIMEEEREASLMLVNVAVGFMVTSFFLSQSYKHVLFIVAGLVVARYMHAARIFKDTPRYSVMLDMPRIVGLALSLIFVMWVITRVLL